MKTIISALVATTLLGSIALADEIDDQIQKLEKENKLLELQKKKKELEMQNQIISKGDSLSSDKKPKKTKNPNSKNGGFIGVEGVLGGGDITLTSDPLVLSKSNTTFDLGLVGGYQHYFGSSQRHGIKVSAHLYSGFGNSWELFFDDKTKDGGTITKSGTISYIPIKFGFDVKYLWDFLQRGQHTLGLNVGLGYEFDSYINGKSESNGFHQDLDSIFLNGFYPVIGLHYYYRHHQFELMYRFGGILDEQKTKIVFDDDDFKQSITLNTKSYLTINYAYRF